MPGVSGQNVEPMLLPPQLNTTFRATMRTIARENASVVTSRGTRKGRQAVIANGPKGDQMPVLLIPGFLTGDWSMGLMADALRKWDFRPRKSGITFNVSCTEELVARLTDRVRQIAAETGRPVALVGWSRGGMLAKLVAMRIPADVAGIVTLASPNANPLAVNHIVDKQLRLITKLNSLGMKRFMGSDCIHGECRKQTELAMEQEFPEHIAYVAFYTRNDGVVDWRACLDTDAHVIEVDGTHLGVGNDVRVIRQIGNVLATFRGTSVPPMRQSNKMGA